MTYSDWESTIPASIKGDVLWKMKVYRISLFLTDIAWEDVSNLVQDTRTKSLSNQLYRAAGSVAANLEEGYSKESEKDRARFYEYALGSARETRGWYYRGRHVLGDDVFDHRAKILAEIIKMLIKIVRSERGNDLHEEISEYKTSNRLYDQIPF